MLSTNFVDGIRGPVGSGKSVGCCMKLFMKAAAQAPALKPDREGIRWRKSRHAIIRNTNPQLRTTTIKTWLDWFNEDEFGQFRWSVPYTHHIKKGDIDAEFIFLALDREEDVKKLLSLDLTFAWINEAREVEKSIIDIATTRVGRYPSMKDGGPTEYGVIMDTNAPEDDHWWPIMAGDSPPPDYITEEERLLLIKPDNWGFFNQPGGMIELKDASKRTIGYESSPTAENAKHLVPGYYENLITGKRKNWIDVYVLNKLGTSEAGKPVYPEFSKETHVLKTIPTIDKHAEMYIGLDFGNTPSAIFGLRFSLGEWLLFKEIITANTKIEMFASIVRHEIQKLKHDGPISIYGDPSGEFNDQHLSTALRIMRAGQVPALPAPSNNPEYRIETVASMLNKMVRGQPAVQISPACKVLIKGFDTGYKYKRMRISGEARYDDKPMKNRYSHPHDACQYMFLGAGEGTQLLLNKKTENKTHPMKRRSNPWGFRSSIRKRRAG